MLNAEKYRAEILGRDCKFGLSNRICKCCCEECATCAFNLENNPNDGLSHACTIRKVKWLLSEYKEPIKVSKFEYEVLKMLEKGDYKYIVRSPSNNLHVYASMPTVGYNDWVAKSGYKSLSAFDDLFQFVKWADTDTMLIKDILENCEVTEK